jgi:threonine efflux protein
MSIATIITLMPFILLHLVGLILPGADFVVISSLGVKYSNQKLLTRIMPSLGIASGIISLCLLSMLLISIQLESSQAGLILLNVLRYLGGGYIIYLAISMFKDSTKAKHSKQIVETQDSKLGNLNWSLFSKGYLTNILNPKAFLLMMAIFSQLITLSVSKESQLTVAIIFGLQGLIWFTLVTLLLGQGLINKFYNQHISLMLKSFALLLFVLGLGVIKG